MALIISLLLLGLLAPAAFASYDIEEDIYLDTIGLLTKYGYPAESHQVTTEDGYILTMHRVTDSPLAPKLEDGESKPVVFLQHGLLSSSADWVVMGPGSSFAYLLADAGYDVWMGNFRGNTFSRAHKSIKPSKAKFWKYSWNEAGIYDLPAMIDYVLAQTGQEKLYYAGHSMGTTTFFVMASQRPEYNDKIHLMFALAPIAYMGHMASPFFQLISKEQLALSVLLPMLGVNEFMPSNELMTLGGKLLCQDGAFTQAVCSNALFLIGGYDSEEMNTTMLPVVLGHAPAGASTRMLLHYAQEINSGKFRQYDYTVSNLFKYGSLTPPKYKLNKITAPVVLLYSQNDWLAAVCDVRKLHKELKNPVGEFGKFKIPFKKFNHLDFVWAIHAKEYVYDTVMDLIACNENPTAACQENLATSDNNVDNAEEERLNLRCLLP